MSQVVADFEGLFDFPLDRFQRVAIDALDRGRSVLVAAPTGAGKTVVGEFACHHAIATDGRAFYTTPIKALSNQKYRDLIDRYGEDRVGLLTGDRSINPGASVVVMTTEVLRNMIYESSAALHGLRHVVLDEVHYLADRERGAVWEEVIIQVPASVQLSCLSATVSNSEEFGAWLDQVREGGCEIIIEEHRPVPLGHHYFVNDRIHPTFKAGKTGQKGSGGGGKGRGKPHPNSKQAQQARASDAERQQLAEQALAGVPNPDVVMLERRAGQRNRVTNKGRRMGPEVRLRYPDRVQTVEELRHRKWLPAIIFVFSRNGCEDAVDQIVRSGIRLTEGHERDQIAELADLLTSDLPADDLRALGYGPFKAALMDGVAAHHAGMVPAFKEVVEVCFQRGLLKVVVATETLALGINMPAKTVVIERLEKWNGESHVLLTPGQYTQLTGRAGRRGIDKRGNAVVLYQRNIDFRTVAGLVGTRTYPLESSFAPSYNMAVNLLRRHDLEQAEVVLGASFAQFQADRSVSGVGRRLADLDAGLRGYKQHLHSSKGDWAEYWRLRTELTRKEKAVARDRRKRGRDRLEDALAALNPGDVLHLPWMGRRGLVAVVGVRTTSKGNLLLDVVTDERALSRVGRRELDRPPSPVGRVRLPEGGNVRQRDYRKAVADRLRAIDPPDESDRGRAPTEPIDDAAQREIDDLRLRVHAHPCHADPDRDDIERWQYRYNEAAKEADRIRSDVERRTGSLVRQLHRILAVLTELGYVTSDHDPTDAGLTLAGIHGELDLLAAETVRRGLLDDLQPAELAAVASLFTYEARRDETERVELPTEAVRQAVDDILDLAMHLREVETLNGVDALRELDGGFIGAAYRWAGGATLEDSVGDWLEMTGGDFVRNVKQLADTVGQLRHVGGPALTTTAELTLDRLRRGIVDA